MKYQTAQEQFWAGTFGTEYIGRNDGLQLVAAKEAMFRRVFASMATVRTAIEFGCNIGVNLSALRQLVPALALTGIEINPDAAAAAKERLPDATIIEGSILDVPLPPPCDLAFTCGVLIHLDPEVLPRVYAALARASSRYVIIAEYYNPSPVMVPYRGNEDRLFKRDFAGEFMTAHCEFKLRDYGFVYRRDPQFPLDDITWFLMEK